MPLQFDVIHFESSFAKMPQALSCVLSEQMPWHVQIPLWQRNYDWGKDQFDTFFKDLSAASAQNPLRLGSLVFACMKSNPETVWVVDGQQRLRTVNNLFLELGCQAIENQRDTESSQMEDQQRIFQKLALTDGLGRRLDDKPYFNDKEQENEFHVAKSFHAKSLEIKALNYINFHIVLVMLSDKHADQEISLEVFNRLLPPYFERLNRQARPLNPEDVLKAKLIFRFRESADFKSVNRLNCCWNRAKRLIYEPMIGDGIEAGYAPLSVSIWDRIDAKPAKVTCPLRDEKSRREAFCRLLFLVGGFVRGEEWKPITITRDQLLAETNPAEAWKKLWCLNRAESQEFLDKFDRLLGLFERYREYLLVTRSHLGDENLQQKVFAKKENWRRVMLQLCCFLNAAFSGHWLSNKYLPILLRELDRHEGKESDQAARHAIQKVEKELFQKLKSEGDENEDSSSGKPNTNPKDPERLVARDWLLWQAYFSEIKGVTEKKIEGANEKNIYRKAVEAALGDIGCAEVPVEKYIQRPVSCLPSSAGAGEIEHWVAMRREDKDKKEIEDKDLNRSANLAFIARGTNQSLRDLTIEEKALRSNSTWWPNLQFLAAISRPAVPGFIGKDRFQKPALDEKFAQIDKFWASAQGEILVLLNEEKCASC